MVANEQMFDRVSRREKDEADPALALSRTWIEAHARTLALCLRQQQLEAEIVLGVGFPTAHLPSPDGIEFDRSSRGEPCDVCRAVHVAEVGRAEASEVLADHSARWQTKDAELGYTATKEAERQAAEKEQALLDELATTPGNSIEGVIAKLAVVLRDVEDNRDASDFPMPQIRSALEDLTRVTSDMGTDRIRPSPSSDAGMLNGQRNTCR